MHSASRLWRVGGGIGSGKSELAAMLGSLGATVVDSDALGHRALEPDGAASADVARVWPSAARGDRIDRRVLAEIVFSDLGELRRLESLVHPAIAQEIERIVSEVEEHIILEVAILRPSLGGDWPLIFVDAPVLTRLERARRRGMSEKDVALRMAAQPSREEWLAEAKIVVDNGDSVGALKRRARDVAVEIGLLGR